MIQPQTYLTVADNTGAKEVSCIRVLRSKENSASISQTYKNDKVTNDRTNYLSLGFNKKFAYKYYVFGTFDYDYHLQQERSWTLGAGMKKRCFNYQVSVRKEITPVLTSSSSSSIHNYVIYLSVNFVPIGGINQVYSTR
jgi:lipopolysaccharide assembly outer membrane protein LptD (OstA)